MKRILIVGGGSIGERHLRCFQQTGRAEVSLCEIRVDLRGELAKRYPIADVFSTLDDALKKTWDAGVICTPAPLHLPMANRFLEKSIAVLIEKPLSISQDGVADLKAKIDSQKTPVSVAYVLRHHPALQAMKKAIAAARFGKPVQIVMTGGQHFPFYRPAYRETYYTKHETGGGAIQDALTHMINAAEWLVGPVTKLVADAEHCLLDGVDVEDTVNILTRHHSVLGSFSLNQHQPANETTLTSICENGMARYEAHHSRWSTCKEPGEPWRVEEEFQLERDDLFIAQANAFLDQCEGQSDSVAACSLEEAEQTLKVNLAALKSWREETWITL